jgi:hypothetical protein
VTSTVTSTATALHVGRRRHRGIDDDSADGGSRALLVLALPTAWSPSSTGELRKAMWSPCSRDSLAVAIHDE